MKPLILKGKLHRFKHNLKNIAEKINVDISEKGIPVLTKRCEEGSCYLVQSNEIEEGELILNAKDVLKLEELQLQYNESNDDKYLVEIGKIVKKLLSQTKDETGRFKDEIETLRV